MKLKDRIRRTVHDDLKFDGPNGISLTRIYVCGIEQFARYVGPKGSIFKLQKYVFKINMWYEKETKIK